MSEAIAIFSLAAMAISFLWMVLASIVQRDIGSVAICFFFMGTVVGDIWDPSEHDECFLGLPSFCETVASTEGGAP